MLIFDRCMRLMDTHADAGWHWIRGLWWWLRRREVLRRDAERRPYGCYWMEWSGVSLADVVNEDETPGVKLGGVGFTRAPQGATSNFEFAYFVSRLVQ